MALWGFGRGHARLNPAPAGWHRGEREVTAPQHTAHKTLRVEGERRERERERENRPQIHTNPGRQGSGAKRITLRVKARTGVPKHPACVKAGYP